MLLNAEILKNSPSFNEYNISNSSTIVVDLVAVANEIDLTCFKYLNNMKTLKMKKIWILTFFDGKNRLLSKFYSGYELGQYWPKNSLSFI